jgi:hypothetical protein
MKRGLVGLIRVGLFALPLVSSGVALAQTDTDVAKPPAEGMPKEKAPGLPGDQAAPEQKSALPQGTPQGTDESQTKSKGTDTLPKGDESSKTKDTIPK